MMRTTVGTTAGVAVQPAALVVVEPVVQKRVLRARLMLGRRARSARDDRVAGRSEISMPLSAWVPRLRGMSSR